MAHSLELIDCFEYFKAGKAQDPAQQPCTGAGGGGIIQQPPSIAAFVGGAQQALSALAAAVKGSICQPSLGNQGQGSKQKALSGCIGLGCSAQQTHHVDSNTGPGCLKGHHEATQLVDAHQLRQYFTEVGLSTPPHPYHFVYHYVCCIP